MVAPLGSPFTSSALDPRTGGAGLVSCSLDTAAIRKRHELTALPDAAGKASLSFATILRSRGRRSRVVDSDGGGPLRRTLAPSEGAAATHVFGCDHACR